MKLITLNYNGSYLHFNRIPDQATYTRKNVCRNITNSKAYRPISSQSTRKQHWKVRCESLRQETTVVVDSLDVMHPRSCQQLDGVVRSLANYVPLSPISFLERAAQVYKHQTSVIYGAFKYTWEETYLRCIKLASAINHLGISHGDVVAALAPNVPAMLELHFAIPMAGGIICPLNTRLDANTVSTLLKHSKAKILFVDYQLLPIAKEALNILIDSNSVSPLLVIISEPNYRSPLKVSPKYDYETLVEGGNVAFSIVRPYDECDPISLNYTSGTTSKPKGVVFSHRGAYMNSISSMFIHGMQEMPTYLWSLPMFHCNGWCFTWGVAIVGGTNVCLRYFNPQDLFDNIVIHKVTHMCGAPTVLNMIANSSVADQKQLPHAVEIMTGGAPPPPTIISKIEELGFRVSHIYGLTETYGPGTWSLWKPEWDELPLEDRVKLKARQGVKHFAMEDVDVKDPITMESVKPDGQSIGEVMFRGNTVMSGYLNDLQATEEALAGGWFHTGDLAVKHPDGFIEVKDRSKDIVISGGENICTIEVETVIYSHPAVLEVAVVARPDDHWGQTPCAFVKLKVGFNNIRAEEIIDHCRNRMPHFMVPKTVIFEDLPRNSTGKVQKFVLREKAEKLGSISSEKVE